MGRRALTLRHGRRDGIPFSGAAAPVVTLLSYSLSGGTLGNAGTLSSSFPGLNLTRASAATVQTAAATIDSTPTTDQARIGTTGAFARGLVIEETRTNLEVNNRNQTAAGWSGAVNTVTTAGAGAGPDGTAGSATRHQVQATGFSNSQGGSLAAGTKYVASEWLRGTSASSPYQMYINDTALNFFPGSATTAWQPVASTVLTIGSGAGFLHYICDATDNGGVGACDLLVDLTQLEAGNWRSEAIITAGASATRAGERVWITSAATVIDTNRLGLSFTFVGKGTPAQLTPTVGAFLWWIDANNNAFIDTAQKLNVKLGGVAVTSASAITWAAGDVVDMWIACGAGANAVVEYRLNGGAKVVLLNTALAGNPSGASTIDICCSGTSNQFSCWLQNLTAYKTGQQPSWA